MFVREAQTVVRFIVASERDLRELCCDDWAVEAFLEGKQEEEEGQQCF